jgi:three-Cys-motif partner protein
MSMADQKTICGESLCFNEIGYWSEVKLDIVKEYAKAYTTILSKGRLKFFYIDGFAGSGVHLSKSSNEFVLGSPLNALNIRPPFHGFFLVDLDGDKTDQLRSFLEVRERPQVRVINGDCNQVLLHDVFPKAKYEDYRRALCVLDPYGLHLNWEVIQTAGQMKSIDLFLNFPIMDMNRNSLWRRPERVSEEGRTRMTAFWGDESWLSAAYRPKQTLFGEEDEKRDNKHVVMAFRERLKSMAGFDHVPEPLPMRNSNRADVYYLFFASQKPVASKIIQHIFKKYQSRMS